MLGGRRVLDELGAPGSNANRIADAEALALFVQDTFSRGRWTFTPGVRVEWIDLERRDFGRADPARTGQALARRENEIREVIPGIGAELRLGEANSLFAGVHRGFSPPSPSSTREVEAEESVNYELGWRHRGERAPVPRGLLPASARARATPRRARASLRLLHLAKTYREPRHWG